MFVYWIINEHLISMSTDPEALYFRFSPYQLEMFAQVKSDVLQGLKYMFCFPPTVFKFNAATWS